MTIPIWATSELQRDVAQVVAVDGDPALGRIVEARQQVGDRRLAGAARADQRRDLAGPGRERDVAQRPARTLETPSSVAVPHPQPLSLARERGREGSPGALSRGGERGRGAASSLQPASPSAAPSTARPRAPGAR